MTNRFSRRTFVKLAGASAASLAAGGQLLDSGSVAAHELPQFAMPTTVRALALDSQAQRVIDRLVSLDAPPINTLTPFNARQSSPVMIAAQTVATELGKPPLEMVHDVSHMLIPGPGGQLLIRIYTPHGDGPFPALVYFHGGGWVITNLDSYDPSCRAITNAAGCVVVSVAYRQAPEWKFPAAPEDCYAATQWVINNASKINVDSKRVAVGGESAGGNLATVVTMMAKDRKGVMPLHQLLIYPITNYAFDTASYQENAAAQPLNKPLMEWFWMHYLARKADGSKPYASPLRATSLKGLPSATVITAEVDPLRDEGEAYAKRLQADGVATTLTRYNGVMHEFFSMSGILDKGKQAVMEAGTALRTAFGTLPPPNIVEMPHLIGMSEAAAKQMLSMKGLTWAFSDPQGPDKLGGLFNEVAPGTVVSTLPAPGTKVERGSSVILGIRAM